MQAEGFMLLTDPDALRETAARRHGRRRHAMERAARELGHHTTIEWLDKVLSFGGCCAYCLTMTRVIVKDHIIPISRGGSNSIDNVVPACVDCNTRKGDLLPEEWNKVVRNWLIMLAAQRGYVGHFA